MYEFIAELAEGEEVKPCSHDKNYFITNQGRVWSTKSHKWAKVSLDKCSMVKYHWRARVGSRQFYIHTLVGRHFLPDYEDGLLILHKDETLEPPALYSVDNLYVGTHADNAQDRDNKGRGRPHIGLAEKEAFQTFVGKYLDLVWYARSMSREMMEERGYNPDIITGALNSQAKVEEQYPDEIDQFKESPDWTHGFNSGCLATMRYVLDALYPTLVSAEESDDGEPWVMGGLEWAEEMFPELDT